MFKLLTVFALCLFYVLVKSAAGLKCYACSATESETSCELDPESVTSGSPVIECSKGGPNVCCIIQRQEWNNNLGEVYSLFRGCQPNCSLDNFVSLVGPSYTAFYTYCSQPLCNGGPGNQPIKDPQEVRQSETTKTENSCIAVLPNIFGCSLMVMIALRNHLFLLGS